MKVEHSAEISECMVIDTSDLSPSVTSSTKMNRYQGKVQKNVLSFFYILLAFPYLVLFAFANNGLANRRVLRATL